MDIICLYMVIILFSFILWEGQQPPPPPPFLA